MNPEDIYITKVYLLNVPLESDYKNSLYFSSKSAQQSYFQSRIVRSYNYSDFSYQRKDHIIRVPEIYDNIYNVNYVMYQNSKYGDKWFYAFVDKLEYINDGRTDLHITTDVIQTWLFDYNLKASFIEREHTDDDTVGKNTIPENLDIGQIISDSMYQDYTVGNASGVFWLVIACNYDPSDNTRSSGIGLYGKYPQGCLWFAWDINPNSYSGTQYEQISQWITDVTNEGHANDIQTIFTLPYQCLTYQYVIEGETIPGDVDHDTHKVISGRGQSINANKTFLKSTFRLFSDYQARNNKLYTYPYSYMRVTNNLGSYNDYKIEDFNEPDVEDQPTDNMTFNTIGVPCEGFSCKLRPTYYQGVQYNEDEALSLGKYPTLSWASDGFTNWLTQNAINLVVGFANNSLGAIQSATRGDILGASGNVLNTIGQSIGNIYQASMIPNTAKGNANAGDISFIQNLNRFKYLHMRPKKEYLKVVDDYFTMFGYKCNQVKIPNKNHRQRWWYTKTINANIDGNIPQEDILKIKDCYNNGITFWRNASEIENYTLSNNVIS